MRFCLVAAGVLSATLASAAVWDPTSDFSTTNGNPNGAWAYGMIDGGGPVLMDNVMTSESAPGWNIVSTGNSVWRNSVNVIQYGVPIGWLSLHPGSSYQATVVRWTAPSGVIGDATVTGEFLAGDGGSMSVAVLKNGNLATPLWNASDFGQFSLQVPVSEGDSIDFAVYGGYAYGNTPLNATISAVVPEPTAAGVGLVASALLSLRRRKQA